MVEISVYAILISQSLNALGIMIVMTTMPFHMMELGGSAFTISMLSSAYNLAQMFCAPALGSLSDRMSRRKVVLMGMMATALCNLMMSTAKSVPALIAARMAVGVALSTGPVEMAYIMELAPDEQDLTRVLALQRVMTSAGALSGPVVARCFDQLSFSVLCTRLVALNVLQVVIGMLLLKEPPKRDLEPPSPGLPTITSVSDLTVTFSDEAIGLFKPLVSMITDPATGLLLIASVTFTAGSQVAEGPGVVFFKQHYGFGQKEVGIFFIVTNVSGLVCGAFMPTMVNNCGARASCIAGCLVSSFVVPLLIVFQGTPWMPYFFGCSIGLYGTLIGIGLITLQRQCCPPSKLGTMLGLQNSMSGAAGTILPPLGGALYGWRNTSPYIVSSVLSFVSAVIFTFVRMPASKGMEDMAVGRTRTGAKSMRRLGTFAKPVYATQDLATQLYMSTMRLEADPELQDIYEEYRERIDRERGTQNAVATVANFNDPKRRPSVADRRGTSAL